MSGLELCVVMVVRSSGPGGGDSDKWYGPLYAGDSVVGCALGHFFRTPFWFSQVPTWSTCGGTGLCFQIHGSYFSMGNC